jgi:PAS domain S-box-containing protein
MPDQNFSTILLVEDDALIAMAKKVQLEQEGYQVTLSNSGENALERIVFNKQGVDMILMDVDLGAGLDGIETARQILAASNIPIVFLSAHSEKEIVEKTEQVTSYGYVLKNSSPAVLIASIKMAFKLHQAHTRLAESETRYRRLIEGSPDAVYTFSNKRGGIYYSPQTEKMLGYPADYFSTHPFLWRESIHAEDRAQIDLAIREFEAGTSFDVEYRLRDAQGGWHWVRDRSIGRQVIGDEVLIEGLATDITERKQTEAHFRMLIENTLVGYAYCKMLYENGIPRDYVYLEVNQAFGRLTGLIDVVGKEISELIPGIRQSSPKLFETYGRVASTGRPESFEYFVQELHSWFSISVDCPEPGYFIALFDNITEKKQAEAALRESEQRYRSLFEHMQEGFALQEVILDEQGHVVDFRVLEANQTYEQHTGVKREDAIGRTIREIQPGVDRGHIERYGRVAQTGEPLIFEYFSRTFNRHLRVSAFCPKAGQFATIFEDVSAMRQAESALRKSESDLSLAMDVAGLAPWEYDPAHDEFILNDRFYHLYATSAEKEGGYRMKPSRYGQRFIHPEDRAYVVSHTALLPSGESNPDFLPYIEHRIVRADGSVRWISAFIRVVRDPGGQMEWMHGVNQDITSRKHDEEKIRFQAKVLREIKQAVIVTDLDGRYIYWNPFAEELFGFLESDRLGIINTELFHNPALLSQIQHIRKQVLAEGIWKGELVPPFTTNDPLILESTVSFLEDQQGKPIGYVSVIDEISARKQTEAAIQKLLTDKDLLIREVHHRVKNNMATISSLLNIQADLAQDTAAAGALKEAESRVRGMMTIYDRLYRSGNYRQLNARVYLGALIDDIAQTWKTPRLKVTMVQEIEPVELAIKLSYPLGIIINECIANAHKHAFPGYSEGILHISLKQADQTLVLSITDNGIGLPAGINLAGASSFGLMLLNTMAQQLEAQVEILRVHGTEFRLTIPYSA